MLIQFRQRYFMQIALAPVKLAAHNLPNIGGRDTAYHARVAEAFARFAEAEPHRFARIDSSGSREDTHAAVMAAESE